MGRASFASLHWHVDSLGIQRMALFRNNQVNLLNLHHTLYAFAANTGGIFVAVYFLRAGLSLVAVLCVMAVVMAGRFLARPAILPLAKRVGLRVLVALGTVGIAVQYALVGSVHGIGAALFAYCIVASLADAFYWTGFHAYFAAVGDNELRGQQTGIREVLASVATIVAPVVGGWALANWGAGTTFLMTATIQAAAALPLLGTQDVSVAREARGTLKAAMIGIKLGVTESWTLATFVLVWQLALFLSLGRNPIAYGGAMAVAAIAGALTGLVAGRMVDIGHGPRAIGIACGAMILAAAVRAASASFPALAIVANALGVFVLGLYTPVAQAPVYNAQKSAPCGLRFAIAAEGACDVGFAAGCLAAASLLALGFSLPATMLLAIVGPLASLLVWRSYQYGNRAERV
jgi:hypothetical protein